MLNQQEILKNWTAIKGGIRNFWGRITDEDLEVARGNIVAVYRLVQERYGETKHSIQDKLERLMDSFDNKSDRGESPDESSYERNPNENRT
jgi:uncharacterized protein YjbJ (UPF0337 family)